jgi:nucleotide-binding universal stress UspA family protein
MSGIVVGLDGSHHSTNALEWALGEAGLRGAPLTVIAVNPIASDIFGLAAQHYPQDEQSRAEVQKATQAQVDQVLSARAGERQVSVTVRAISGLPADELIKASAGADLLVLGARGTGGFGRLLMGSVSSQVTEHALCPVVIVPKDRSR